MALSVRVASEVIEDLQEISDYLLPLNEAACLRIVESLIAGYKSLGQFSYRGRSRDDLSPGLRNLVEENYLIFYRVEAEDVFVVRILHGARDLSAIFAPLDTSTQRN